MLIDKAVLEQAKLDAHTEWLRRLLDRLIADENELDFVSFAPSQNKPA